MGGTAAPPIKPHRHRWRTRLLGLVAWLVCGCALAATPAGTAAVGLPSIQIFTPADYRGAAQNWSLAQDRQGLIYVGNVESGVLVFDGARWRRIPVPNQAAVRSLALGGDGRIYVGTVGDLGYLAAAADGKLVFVSLRNQLPAADRNFSDVWAIHPSRDGVYFTTRHRIFRYANGRMRVWQAPTSFHLSFLIGDTLYVRVPDRGLMRLVDGTLQAVPGGERFAQERIYALLPWHDPTARPGDLLIGTRSHGWQVYHDGQYRPWGSDARAAIDTSALYGARWLSDGRLAVATLRGGLFLLDAQGHLLQKLDHSNGLHSDMVLALLEDSQHGLWLAAGNGVARIGVDSPLSLFDTRNGLRGEIQALHRYAGRLYAGTSEGLFELTEGVNARFAQYQPMHDQVWDFAAADGSFLAAGENGVYVLAKDGSWQLIPPGGSIHYTAVLDLQVDQRDAARVFAACNDGLAVLRHTPAGWVDEGHLKGIHEEVRTLVQDRAGALWAGLWGGGLIRLRFPVGWQGPASAATVDIHRYGKADGLPDGLMQPVRINDQVRFATDHGIYRYDAASQRFAPDADFTGILDGNRLAVDSLRQNGDGTVWMTFTDADGIRQTGHAQRLDGRWQWQGALLQPLAGAGANAFLDEADGTTWLGTDNGLFRYQDELGKALPAPAPTLLRMVAVNGGNAYFASYLATHVPRFTHDQNALRFEFALPSYDHPAANEYQVWMQGVDHTWSPWSGNSYRDYTSLPAGHYVFHVRSRNVYDQLGRAASFNFRVLPPWYASLWAWLLWAALALLALWLLLRWRSAALRRRNRMLEALVEQRTNELATANLALREANEALSLQAVTDPLTGLRNRRYLREHIERDLAALHSPEAEPAANLPLVFLMVDIDHFKRVNDTWGHAAGDLVLQQLSDILLAATRKSDTSIRRGGEEFLVVARLDTPDAGARLAERVRGAVAAHRFDLGEGRHTQITCSVGFASYPPFAEAADTLDWEQVVGLADTCLYAAKRSGRNAWIGMAPMEQAPVGELMDALRAALECHPAPGPLALFASWPERAAPLNAETAS